MDCHSGKDTTAKASGSTHLKFDSSRQNCGCDMHPVSTIQSALRHGYCGPSSPYPFTYTTASLNRLCPNWRQWKQRLETMD